MENEPPKKYWLGTPPSTCNACGGRMGSVFTDGRLPGMGWGMFCHPCYPSHGGKHGLGLGQQYRRQPDGQWLKVKG